MTVNYELETSGKKLAWFDVRHCRGVWLRRSRRIPSNLVMLVDVSADYRIEFLDILRPRGYICTAHNTHAILGHATTPPRNKLRRNLTECYYINITLARLNCKLPDDGRRPKHVGAI